MRNINLAAVHHVPFGEYRYCNDDASVSIMIKTAKGDWQAVYLNTHPTYGGQMFVKQTSRLAMECVASDDMFDYYQINFTPSDPRFKYIFELISAGIKLFYTPDGIKAQSELISVDGIASFAYSYAYPAESKPEWAKACVAYQIFPDRFCRLAKQEKQQAMPLEKWGSKNISSDKYFGGNLRGIISKVPYLRRLGVKLIYMTPIFESDTSHRYNTFDYYKIDPMIGTEEELKELVSLLHKNDMRLMLDGVFNHSGIKFAPFVHAEQNRESSQYYNWFHFGAKESPECGYACFAHEKYMPKLNLKNEQAAEYFINVGKYWIEKCDIDGWRMDVSPEVYPDFWRKFRTAIKQVKQDVLMVAECWDDSREWCTNGDMFDSTMHYVWSNAVWNMFAYCNISISDFDARINRALINYPKGVLDVLWNIIGSHDTARFITRAGEMLERLEAAAFFQMTSLGIPIIYYGDELGMKGENDPYCRYPMQWNNSNDNTILRYYKLLIGLRQKFVALQKGDYRTFVIDEEQGIYAYIRSYENESVLCIICAKQIDQSRLTLKLPSVLAKRIYLRDEISQEKYNCTNSCLVLPYKYGRCFAFPISKTLDQLAK